MSKDGAQQSQVASQSFVHADEAEVQDARAKAAAAGVPSSEPMTLEELEAVQARMAAKKQQDILSQPHDFLSQGRSVTDATYRDVTSPTTESDVVRQSVDDRASRDELEAADTVSVQGDVQGPPAERPEAGGNSLPEHEDRPEEDDDLAAVKVNICLHQKSMSSEHACYKLPG